MYNFDKVVDRRNTGSLKWDVKENELPMWVADMDFETAPEILACIRNRVSHGIFGYHIITEDWYGAYVNWWKKMHRFEMQKEWLIFATGVIPILSSAVRKLTTVGENVLIQTPVYNNFFNCIQNNGRNVLESPLIYEEGVYRIDFDDLEKKLADAQTTLMFLCNPHNPIGKIWDRETLQKVGELAAKHHVIVISDEIHCDLTAPGKEYVPFASVSEICRENSITCIAPTKTFNIAGIQSAAVVLPNEVLRHKMWRALNTDEVAEPNTFAIPAVVAAFKKGGAWLTELKSYLQSNKEMAEQFLKENLPELRIVSMEATYLLWVDCSRITNDSGELAEYIREKTGLYLTRGDAYGESGKTFLRWNVACPKALLIDGLARMRDGVNQYKNRL